MPSLKAQLRFPPLPRSPFLTALPLHCSRPALLPLFAPLSFFPLHFHLVLFLLPSALADIFFSPCLALPCPDLLPHKLTHIQNELTKRSAICSHLPLSPLPLCCASALHKWQIIVRPSPIWHLLFLLLLLLLFMITNYCISLVHKTRRRSRRSNKNNKQKVGVISITAVGEFSVSPYGSVN